MSAFFIATVTMKDGEKFQEYAAKSTGTFQPFGGELIIKGKFNGTLVGNADHQAAAIIKFPDIEALENWYASDAYQALIPLRNEAAEMTLVKYEVPRSLSNLR